MKNPGGFFHNRGFSVFRGVLLVFIVVLVCVVGCVGVHVVRKFCPVVRRFVSGICVCGVLFVVHTV